MTDKQIIIDGVDVKDCKRRIGKDNFCRYYKRPCAENNYNCIWKKNLRKEQECEKKSWEIGNLGYKIKNQRKEINIRLEQLDQLKGENVRVLKQLEFVRTLNTVQEAEIRKLKQTLAEIKPILEFYANSNMGEEQPDRTYKLMLYGSYITVYDPKPAKQALQKISECEVRDDKSNG